MVSTDWAIQHYLILVYSKYDRFCSPQCYLQLCYFRKMELDFQCRVVRTWHLHSHRMSLEGSFFLYTTADGHNTVFSQLQVNSQKLPHFLFINALLTPTESLLELAYK